MSAVDPEAVLTYWFGADHRGADVEDQPDPALVKRWFEANSDVDAEITSLFGATLERLVDGELESWCEAPRGRLAYIIVGDQFSRNIHRGTAAAFATDALALTAARAGVVLGHDAALTLVERSFFYMPFEHSESILDQHTAVGLFTALRDLATGARRQTAGNNIRWAQQHRDIIVRFGRFPHRNAVLARESSSEEATYLQDSSSFGQG